MQQFKDHWNDLQPQLVSIVITVLIILTMVIIIHFKLKKQKVDKAPKGVMLIAEQYVMGIDSLFKSVAKDTLSPMAPYIFTILSFLTVGNLMGLLGFYEPVTSYSVPLVLGLIAWIGIFVTAFIYQRFRYLKKYVHNPIELISSISPLISISFRIFGNIIGGATIMYLIYHVIGYVWSFVPVLGEVNLLAVLLAPPFHIYFDIFSGIIQAFVFSLLTAVYWAAESTSDDAIAIANKKKKVTVFEMQSEGPHHVRTI